MAIKILHLTSELPYSPGGTGGALRQYEMLASLADAGHDVTVVCPVFPFQWREQKPSEVLAAGGVRLLATPRPRSRRQQLAFGVRRDPEVLVKAVTRPYYAFQASLLWESMRPAVKRAITESRPDVITVEHDYNAVWQEKIPSAIPRVLTLHNVTELYYATRATSGSPAARAAYLLEARRMRALSDRHLPRFDHLIAVSEQEAAHLRARYDVSVDVAPNGTRLREEAAAIPAGSSPIVLFTGTLNHPPNRDGIIWFAENVWPRVRREVGDARLRIVGRSPVPQVLDLHDEANGIEVFPDVPAMEPFYDEATLTVVPLHAGGGTRLKILDAFASARPVVSTHLGAEGIDASDGEHVLLRDDAETFGKAVVSVLTDRALAKRLGDAGRVRAEALYGWKTIGAKYARILVHVADAAAHRETATPPAR